MGFLDAIGDLAGGFNQGVQSGMNAGFRIRDRQRRDRLLERELAKEDRALELQDQERQLRDQQQGIVRGRGESRVDLPEPELPDALFGGIGLAADADAPGAIMGRQLGLQGPVEDFGDSARRIRQIQGTTDADIEGRIGERDPVHIGRPFAFQDPNRVAAFQRGQQQPLATALDEMDFGLGPGDDIPQSVRAAALEAGSLAPATEFLSSQASEQQLGALKEELARKYPELATQIGLAQSQDELAKLIPGPLTELDEARLREINARIDGLQKPRDERGPGRLTEAQGIKGVEDDVAIIETDENGNPFVAGYRIGRAEIDRLGKKRYDGTLKPGEIQEAVDAAAGRGGSGPRRGLFELEGGTIQTVPGHGIADRGGRPSPRAGPPRNPGPVANSRPPAEPGQGGRQEPDMDAASRVLPPDQAQLLDMAINAAVPTPDSRSRIRTPPARRTTGSRPPAEHDQGGDQQPTLDLEEGRSLVATLVSAGRDRDQVATILAEEGFDEDEVAQLLEGVQ